MTYRMKCFIVWVIYLFVPHLLLWAIMRDYRSLLDFVANYASRFREETDYKDVKIKVYMHDVEECLFEGITGQYRTWRNNPMKHLMYLSVYRFFVVDGTIEIYLEYNQKQLLKYRIAKLKGASK